MTTTLEAMARGSARLARIMLIEGIETPVAECSQADAQAALVGTDWEGKAAYEGFFSVTNRQSTNPWEPFQAGGGGTVTIPADEFGVLTHRTAGGHETELTATIDRDDVVLHVQSTDGWDSSGELHIGTECFSYAVTNSTTFTATTRGLYCPFATAQHEGFVRFTHDHRVEPVPYAPNLAPRVTQYPREWAGRWVGIWAHTYDENGINSKADALCIFAGRLVEVHDTEDGHTVCVLEHVFTSMRDATVGRDQVTAEVGDGVYLAPGMEFNMLDTDGSGFSLVADQLTVITGTPSSVNEIQSGIYTLADLFSALNQWWSGERTASRLFGSYTINTATISGGAQRVKIYWNISGSGTVGFDITLPDIVAAFFGFNDGESSTLGSSTFSVQGDSDENNHFYKDWVPMRNVISAGGTSNPLFPVQEARVKIEAVSGSFQDQYASLPSTIQPNTSSGLEWGIFQIGDQILVLAAFHDYGDGTYELRNIGPLSVWYSALASQDQNALRRLSKRIDDATPTTVRQVFIFEMDAASFLKCVMVSTGTAGFNDSDWDKLPFGCGVGYPGELFYPHFYTTADNLPGAAKSVGIIIDRPTKLSELIGSDLVLRHAFPVWKSGGIRLATWQTPSAALAVASLTEESKAEPAGNKTSQRATTVLSDEWAKKIIKIRFNRTIADNGDQYKSVINIEDRTAVDDSGDQGDVFTINARNTFSEFVGSGSGIEEIVPNTFIPPLTMFTRASRKLRRSITLPFYEGYAPGDVISLSDSFARDPSSGRRLISGRPATIVGISTDLGGRQADGSVANLVGEVEVLVVDTNRIFAYAPSALFDGGNYSAIDNTITLEDHEYSESAESSDAEQATAAGYSVRITEVDPVDPATAISYTRGLVSRSGSDIVHDGAALGSGGGETAFDAAKKYRITYDTYSVAIDGQHDKAFQADDADGLIEDVAQADMFGIALSPIAATVSAPADLGEFHADVDVGDGKAYDVGSLKGFARLIDNLIDYKTAIRNPTVGHTVMENADYSSGQGFKLVSIEPIYLSGGLTTNAVLRYLRVGPIFRSSDGSTVSLRVWFNRGAPTYAGVNDAQYNPPGGYLEFTTDSTDWTISNGVMNVATKEPMTGFGWLMIEAGFKCQTLGLAYVNEGPRLAA